MKRLHKSMIAVSVVVLLSVVCVLPVAAQGGVVPETIEDASQLAQYQMHMQDIHVVPSGSTDGEVVDRNQLAQYQAEQAGSIGVVPKREPAPWHVEFNQVSDSNELATYMDRMVDITVPPQNQ